MLQKEYIYLATQGEDRKMECEQKVRGNVYRPGAVSG